AAAAFFFAAAQAHVMTDLKLFGHAQQMPLPYQMSAQLGKVPFLEFGKAMKQRLGGDQPQHGVSEKLEIFVITARRSAARRTAARRTAARRTAARAQRLNLARLRAVGKRLLKQFAALEVV